MPKFQVISSGVEAPAAHAAVGGGKVVVKAQVHAGGRGKAGFVKLVKSPEEAVEAARFMLSNRMRSPQTPPEGLEVKKLLVAMAADIADRKGGGKEEFYLAVTTDRKTRRNILIASREGGVEIETIAHERPEAIIKEPMHPIAGLLPNQARRVAFDLHRRPLAGGGARQQQRRVRCVDADAQVGLGGRRGRGR